MEELQQQQRLERAMALYRTESHQSNISQLSIASGLRDDYYVGNADEEVLSSSSLQSDDESVIIQKSLSFFSKYGGESEEERFDLDADDISDDRIARMQTHIIDCVVTLMRVQSIQSEERVEASQPSHKLFSSVVMKLLCHNSANAIKEFGALDGLKTLDRRPMITPAAATAGSGVKPRLDSSVTSSAGIGYLLQAFPDEQKSRDSRYWLKLHWLAALGCESLTARRPCHHQQRPPGNCQGVEPLVGDDPSPYSGGGGQHVDSEVACGLLLC